MDAGAALRGHRGGAHRDPRRDPHARRRARRPGVRALAVGALPGPRARARHAGDGVLGAADHPRGHPRLPRAPLPAREHGRLGGRGLHARGGGRRPGAPLPRDAGRSGARPVRAPGPDVVTLDVVRRPTEQAHLVYGVRSVVALRRAALGAGRAEPRPRGRPVEPAVPEGARAARPGLLGVVGAGGLRGRRLAGRGGRDGRPSTSTRCCRSSARSSSCWRPRA